MSKKRNKVTKGMKYIQKITRHQTLMNKHIINKHKGDK